MSELLYQTELDGMRHIAPDKEVKANDFVYVVDEIYKDDLTLFKNKKTVGGALDLKLVKLVLIKKVSSFEQESLKFNQLYEAKAGVVFTTQNRLNKNQVFQLDSKFYIVNNIVKEIDKPQTLELTEIQYTLATNIYTVYKRKVGGKKEAYKRCASYKEVLSLIWKLREKREESCYYTLS